MSVVITFLLSICIIGIVQAQQPIITVASTSINPMNYTAYICNRPSNLSSQSLSYQIECTASNLYANTNMLSNEFTSLTYVLILIIVIFSMAIIFLHRRIVRLEKLITKKK